MKYQSNDSRNRIYISHLLPDKEMKELIEETGAGVESIDFSISENLDHLSESVNSYKKRMKEMGTENLILHGPFLDLNPVAFDSEILRVTKLRFAQAYSAAQELGAQKIVYHTCYHPDIYYLIGWADRMASFFHEFLKERSEIDVVMENVFDRQWQPLMDVKRKVQEINFALCLDIGHANCYSHLPVTEWVKNLFPYIEHMHVHDNMGEKDSHLALGQGSIEIEKVFKKVKKSKCTYTIECNTKDDVRESWRKLKGLLE